jgi:hypothetical protein
MVLLSEFFKIWGNHFGVSNFEPKLSFDERVYYQVMLMERFSCYEEIKECLLWANDLNGPGQEVDEWSDFIIAAQMPSY